MVEMVKMVGSAALSQRGAAAMAGSSSHLSQDAGLRGIVKNLAGACCDSEQGDITEYATLEDLETMQWRRQSCVRCILACSGGSHGL